MSLGTVDEVVRCVGLTTERPDDLLERYLDRTRKERFRLSLDSRKGDGVGVCNSSHSGPGEDEIGDNESFRIALQTDDSWDGVGTNLTDSPAWPFGV